MKTLILFMYFRAIDDALRDTNFSAYSAAPVLFKVQNVHGQLLAEGVTDGNQPTRVSLPEAGMPDQVFVRIVFPNGRSVSKRVEFASHVEARVTFDDEDLAGDEWAKWALTRSRRAPAGQASISKFDNVWFRLWTQAGAVWEPSSELPRTNSVSNAAARQVDLELGDERPHLLQFGGAHVSWTFVSLPPGRCRVYFTANPEPHSTSLPVKLVVTSFRPEAETLLEFLSRDSLRAADAMMKFDPVATRLLSVKYEDPVSAVIGAYVLLRIGRWKAIDPLWFENLYQSFPWSSDAALIRCAVTARRGLSDTRQLTEFLHQLKDCLDRGFPMFEEGHRMLLEVQSVAHAILQHSGQSTPDLPEIVERCRALSAARVWVGSNFAFLGTAPGAPSSTRHKGGAPEDGEEMGMEAEPSAFGGLSFSRSRLEDSPLSIGRQAAAGRKRRLSSRHDVVYLKNL